MNFKKFPRGIAGVTATTKCSIGHPNGLSFGSTPPALDQVISQKKRSLRVLACTWSGPKASSFKQQAQRDSSFKRQASSPSLQGSSAKPQAASSWTMDPGKSFTVLGPRASTKINELLGWRT